MTVTEIRTMLLNTIRQIRAFCHVACSSLAEHKSIQRPSDGVHFVIPIPSPPGKDGACLLLPIEGDGELRRLTWCDDAHHGGSYSEQENVVPVDELTGAIDSAYKTARAAAELAVREQLQREAQERRENEVQRRLGVLVGFFHGQ